MDSVDSLAIEESSLPHGKQNEYLIVFLLAFISYLASVDSMLLMPLGNIVMKTFNVSPIQSTTVVSVYSLLAGISGFTSASFMDQFDRKKLLVFTFMGFIIGTALCGFAYNFNLLILYRGITGIFGGIVGGVGVAIISDIVPYKRRATAMSIMSLSFAVAAITGVPFGLFLAKQFSIQMPFKILALISLFALIAIIVWIPAINTHLKHKHPFRNPFLTIKDIFHDHNQMMALLLSFLLVFSHYVVIQFIVPYMVNNVGFDENLVPIMYAIGGVCTIATSPFIGKISDKKGNYPSFVALVLLSFIPIVASTHIHRTSMPMATIICSFFFILAAGRMIPAYTLMSAATIPQKRGGFMSMRSACMELGTGVASIASGMIVRQGVGGRIENFHYVGYVSVLTGLLAIYVASRVKVVSLV
ncbi:MAG: sugar transporter [Bacteroidota bacterium]|nr:sugar transporter [Bacteroidota bacterium]